MCGIAGFFAHENQVPPRVISTMTGCLAHRGPDAEGFFRDEHVVFGHRRLSIIDLSTAANQPMTSQDERWVMMFNGEVYNFRELARELSVGLRTTSDTEVMLEMFAAYGPKAVEKFNGMFTIALYDRNRQELFLFRDRIGVKPLFYYQDHDAWFFASELKALQAVSDIRRNLTLNQQAVSLYLRLGYIPGPHTIWNEIRKFPSGTMLRINRHECEWTSFWKAEDQIKTHVADDVAEAKGELHRLLKNAVGLRLISDVPFGTFLSGGIDSTLVTVLAQSQSSLPVNTFTIGFKEEKFNEARYAEAIARHLNTTHHEFILQYDDALQWCVTAVDLYDEPLAESSSIPTLLVSDLARRQVKMILSGDGGDELFMGYGMYRWANRLNNPLIHLFHRPLAKLLSLMSSRWQRAGTLLNYDGEEQLPVHIFSQEQYQFSSAEARRLLGNKFVPSFIPLPDSSARSLSVSEKQSLFDLAFYLKDDLLVKVDRATMHHSLECRTPFLDYRIVEFALNLSEMMKMKKGELKWLPRLLLRDLLPAELFDRPKQGFGIPLNSWLKKELRYLVDEYLSAEKLNATGMLNSDEVQRIKEQFFSGRNYLYNRLWNLIVLQRWCAKNLG